MGGPTFSPFVKKEQRRLSQGPNIPKVLILNPMNDTTVRLFMYVQVVEKGKSTFARLSRRVIGGTAGCGPSCYPSEQHHS